jgi:phosphoglucosamine mutase
VEDVQRFPQVLVNVRVAEKRPLDSLPGVTEAVRRIEGELDGRGRVLIRYSGTEPKARVMVEGEDEGRVKELAEELADRLRRALGPGDL